MKKQDMNLLERYHYDQKTQANKQSPIRIYIIVLVSSILIAGAYTFSLYIENNGLKTEKLRLQTYINNENTLNNLNEVKSVQAKLDLLDMIEEEATTLVDVMDFMPKLSHYTLDIVDEKKPTTINILVTSFEENTLYLDCSAKYASDFSNYVLNLKETQHFEEVANFGYEYNEETYRYEGTIVLLLKGGQ